MKTFLIATVLIIGLGFITVKGLDRHENHECITWQAQAEQYEHFHATHWQVEQCERHNIDLSAYLK